MIKDYKVIIATQATNLIKNQYWPVSKACVASFSDIEYIDEVILYTCENEDNTVEEHSVSSKVKFFKNENKEWNGGLSSYEAWWGANNEIFQLIAKRSKKGEKIILITPSIEDYFTPNFSKDLSIAIENLIDSNCDGFALPWTKCYSVNIMETPGLRYRDMVSGQSLQVGVFKYNNEKNALWYGFNVFEGPLEKIVDGIIGNKDFNIFIPKNFTTTSIQYDNWFFTMDRLESKLKNHCEWSVYNFNSAKEAIFAKFAKKMINYRCYKFNKNNHPKRIIDIIEKQLNENHLGHSYFNWVNFE